jgi:GAF domain-containing protein
LQNAALPLEDLLAKAVERLHESHPQFHWTGIYELFPDNVLRLGPFIGAPTDHVFIAVGRGVCGSAVAERRNMNVPTSRRPPSTWRARARRARSWWC